MRPDYTRLVLTGAIQALSVPDQVQYLQVTTLGSNTFKIGRLSDLSEYLTIAANGAYEFQRESAPLRDILYVQGTALDVLEIEYHT
jgi:hypothetical protein